jgi:hypothetical protein
MCDNPAFTLQAAAFHARATGDLLKSTILSINSAMEGYLTLVTLKFTGIKLRSVWVVLDRQQLTWYDRLDLADQSPKKLKGVMFVRDAKFRKASEPNTAHALIIECENVKTTFACPTADVQSTWYKVLSRAVRLHVEEATNDALPKQYRAQLGIGLEDKLSKALLARTYKRLCLQAHPDKGGNPEVFNKIKEAYNHLMTVQTYQDEMDSTEAEHYEVTLRKKDSKVGLGLSVSEDRLHNRMLVSKLNEDAEIVEISEEAEGEIRPGDRIIGIDNDDCSHWPVSRVIARLSLVRVPVGGTVVFTCERRVPKDSSDSDGDGTERYSISPEPSPTPSMSYQPNRSPMSVHGLGGSTPKSDSSSVREGSATQPTHTSTATDVSTSTSSHFAFPAGDTQPHAESAVTDSNEVPDSTGAVPNAPTLASSTTASAATTAATHDGNSTQSSVQARAAARERLRLRALAAINTDPEPAVVLPAAVLAPAPSDTEHTTVVAPAVPAAVVGEHAAPLQSYGLPSAAARNVRQQFSAAYTEETGSYSNADEGKTARRSESPPPPPPPPAPAPASASAPLAEGSRLNLEEQKRAATGRSGAGSHAETTSRSATVPTRRLGPWTASATVAHETHQVAASSTTAAAEDMPER